MGLKLILFGNAFISLKYGLEEGGWITKVVRGSYGVGIWKEIYKETSRLKMNSSLEWKRGKILGICLV